MNMLMPQQQAGQAPQGQAQAAPQGGAMMQPNPPPSALMAGMQAQHAAAAAKLDKVDEALAKAKAVRTQLSHLTTLGDLVDEDDVVRAASKIVAAGVEPMTMASLLADMPTSGSEAIASWLAGQEQQFRQKEAQLNAMAGMVRHETGLAALRLLAAHRFGGLAEPAESPPSGANPLMPPQGQMSPAPLGIDNSAPAMAPTGAPGGNALNEESPI